MRTLEFSELDAVSGGEILVAPGELGIALTDNTLVVITGTAEGSALLGTIGAGFTVFSAGYAVGEFLVNYTDFEHWVGGWMYTAVQCFN